MLKAIAATIVLAASMVGWQGTAWALAICNCCTAQAGSTCAEACAAIAAPTGHCPVFVDYAATASPDPLNGTSFMGISIGEPSEPQLESLRRFLEKHRRQARADYSRAIAKFDAGKMSEEDFTKAKARFDEAMVNYNHAIHAYLVRLGRKTD